MLQLGTLVQTVSNHELLLQQIQAYEKNEKLKMFDILSKLQGLLPLAKSVDVIKQIIMAFTGKLLSLLEQHKVLDNMELSEEVLKCVKSFWSICSSKQNSLTTSQQFGRWESALLEPITSLASIVIDLYITAHGTREKQTLWSKRLFSWINLDLPDRATKVALLEVSGYKKPGSSIVGPMVKHVLQRKFDSDSNPEYLLHFLLVKKWQRVGDFADVIKLSQRLKAPVNFIEWLQTYWNDASDYVPEDKSLQGVLVSQFLLDLDTEDVLESLIDVLQMAIFPENPDGAPTPGTFSDTPLFVVEKQGDETARQKRKRSVSDTNNEDSHADKVMENGRQSPKKKKQKSSAGTRETGVERNEFGFVLDRAPAALKENDMNTEYAEVKESLSKIKAIQKPMTADVENSEDEEDEEIEDSSNDEDNEDSDDNGDDGESSEEYESLEEEDGSGDIEHSQPVHKKKRTDNGLFNSSMGSNNLAADVLKQKNILISDPVASSYFSNTKDSSFSVYHVARDDHPVDIPSQTIIDENEPRHKSQLMEDDIASKLSAIRKSTPIAPDTPTRKSTRVRSVKVKGEATPKRKSISNTSNVLKDWLRSPVSNVTTTAQLADSDDGEEESAKSNTQSTTGKTLTQIKCRQNSDENSPGKELRKQDVFPNPPLKTYSKRDRKLSEKAVECIKTPKRSKSTPLVKSAKRQDDTEEEDIDFNQSRKFEASAMSTPLTSKPASARKASAKKLGLISTPLKLGEEENLSNELDEELDVDKPQKKTPSSKRKSINKTPKSSKILSSGEKKPTPSPTVNRRKSLRSADHK